MAEGDPEKSYFGPLNFPDQTESESRMHTTPNSLCSSCACVLCEINFILPLEEQNMLTHFYTDHRLVIADVHVVADIKKYVDYWKESFKGYDLAEFCTTMLLDQTPDGKYSKDEKYYLLSDVLPRDSELRMMLQKQKLEAVLTRHQYERTALDFERECLFCRQILKGARANFLQHLYEKHNLYLGKPNSLVYIDEMINMLQEKLERFECLYCEKIFKDRNILKEHMRKKIHKQINPENKLFDKFYLVNYTNPIKRKGKNTKVKPKTTSTKIRMIDNEENSNSESNSDWSDWEEEALKINCLFCKHTETQYSQLLEHMKSEHSFDFINIVKDNDFYQKVKIVNYIRRQIHVLQCIACDEKFNNLDQLLKHSSDENHLNINNRDLWDQPEYFFPTYEDDSFLCQLEGNGKDWVEPESSDDGLLVEPMNSSLVIDSSP